jgi:hypothetical protein
MAGQSLFGAGITFLAALPWLKSAAVSLWRRAPRWCARAMTWTREAAVALAFLAVAIFVSIVMLYAVYTLGIYARQAFR